MMGRILTFSLLFSLYFAISVTSYFKFYNLFVFISISQISLLCCASAILADQLPYPLQLFYLAANNVGIIPPYQAASRYMAAEKTMTRDEKSSKVPTKQSQGNEEVIEGEASQFHSQDSRGRALFGYTTPDQSRIEARSEDGTVKGSYSYLDAWGKAVKVTACRLAVLLFWASSTNLRLHNLS
jgi:hypothetical protein